MRRRLLLVTLTVSLSASVLLRAADDFVITRFSDYVDAIRTQAGIPGLAMALIRSGDLVTTERAYGRQDIERNRPTEATTPFQLDGTTQIVTATLVLRCVEEGRLSLDDRVSHYAPALAGRPDLDVTIRQALSHTTQTGEGLVFTYRLDRLDALAAALASCARVPFRTAVANQLDQLAMVDSVPGVDTVAAMTDAADPKQAATLERYTAVLDKLAKPYAVDSKGRATASGYTVAGLTPTGGLISTVRDLTRFDAALRKGVLIKPETLAEAWTSPVDREGLRLPHGLGWFVQQYNGERIVWQFGVSDNASSSMIIMVPARGLTLILLANSQGLVRPFTLSAGDVTVSPFARTFLSVFVR